MLPPAQTRLMAGRLKKGATQPLWDGKNGEENRAGTEAGVDLVMINEAWSEAVWYVE
jgi:hypothetical protein